MEKRMKSPMQIIVWIVFAVVFGVIPQARSQQRSCRK
jgi:hypothetical protein